MKGITTNHEMDYSVNTLVEVYADRQFALCESCFWSVTILNSTQKNIRIINYCPVCSNNNVSLIPLANDEIYNMNIRSKGGLELRFSKAIKL
ncbi:MAG TPA: hypothetical protein VEL11_12650 [Candidatus Bathyarchaeia archaeon]|nr:hypothetical protein [Candidatus Bathyarchaeia archaeon]